MKRVRRLAIAILVLGGCGRIGFGGGDDAGGDDGPVGDGSRLGVGLEFYYPLDQSAGHAVPDASGHARNGYAWDPTTHMQWLAGGGVVGGALHFDGTAYESFALFPAAGSMCGSAPALTGSLTLSAWAKFDSFGDWSGYSLGDFIIGRGEGGGTGGGWGLGATNGCGAETAGFEVSVDSGRYAIVCGTTALSPGTWHHLAGVFDAAAQTMDVYVDGMLDTGPMTSDSAAIPSSSVPTGMCPYLGAGANQQHLLVGSVDEARVYSRPLTAAELAQLATP
ncbi:MAG TPA: LamG domain-containing protein [Kofleriaceae bacterium]